MSKVRKRLPKDIAKKLGFKVKERSKDGKNARYCLSKEDLELYNSILEGECCDNINSNTNGYKGKDTSSNDLSAWCDAENRLLSKEEFCSRHNIDTSTIHSAKLVSHTGTPFYNIAFKDNNDNSLEDVDWESVKKYLFKEISKLNHTHTNGSVNRRKEGVLVISDLHLGAYIDNLIRTPDFSITKVVDGFKSIIKEVNSFKYSKVHVYILGDCIESFTGMSHPDSWKGLQKGMHGAEVVKLATKIIHELLEKINNLGNIKLIAGNHDRVTSNNKEDRDGDAANLIAWALELIGYNVEFNPSVITDEVEGICYVLTHGHHGISKRATKDIIWDYGVQGKFNFLMEGHLHSRIQKLSTAQRNSFQTTKDDSIDCRRQVVPSIFTGNSYSENLGFTSTAGFLIIEDNGKGQPNVFDFSI